MHKSFATRAPPVRFASDGSTQCFRCTNYMFEIGQFASKNNIYPVSVSVCDSLTCGRTRTGARVNVDGARFGIVDKRCATDTDMYRIDLLPGPRGIFARRPIFTRPFIDIIRTRHV